MSFFKIGCKNFDLSKKTLVMGVLNVTPDSFSDGGKFLSVDKAVKHAIKMEKQGADIIDIGGESTRPGAKKVNVDDEIKRIKPVVEQLVKKINIPISIDTYKSKIAREILDLGASMINDITALQGDKHLASVIADFDVPVCLMHMKGNPRNMQINPEYDDVVKEIYAFLKEKTEYAMFCDIKKENIIVDPGLGFGKRTGHGIEDNCEILKRLSKFKKLGFPLLIGASRKTFIGNIYGKTKQLPVSKRLYESLAAATIAVMNGANIVRVHDVKETKRCIDMIDFIIKKV